jgi:hypothetical protein
MEGGSGTWGRAVHHAPTEMATTEAIANVHPRRRDMGSRSPWFMMTNHGLRTTNYGYYQSYFTPNRMIRGPIMVDGSSNAEPEFHVMFGAAAVFPRL